MEQVYTLEANGHLKSGLNSKVCHFIYTSLYPVGNFQSGAHLRLCSTWTKHAEVLEACNIFESEYDASSEQLEAIVRKSGKGEDILAIKYRPSMDRFSDGQGRPLTFFHGVVGIPKALDTQSVAAFSQDVEDVYLKLFSVRGSPADEKQLMEASTTRVIDAALAGLRGIQTAYGELQEQLVTITAGAKAQMLKTIKQYAPREGMAETADTRPRDERVRDAYVNCLWTIKEVLQKNDEHNQRMEQFILALNALSDKWLSSPGSH